MAKVIMVQGTMSGVGKSLVTAGLCRVFKQDGYKVAPFKSQNMALNSFITEEGLEMGRAQVMQAEAAGVKPSVLMNPILLKPTTDVGSQVIVNGEVRGNMKAADYFKYKKSLIPEIMKAYKKLEEEYDIIVIEGAGSPAEINLKAEDIVNMGMAKLVKAPVLLVGDIDRGGVFAQLIGTVQLLEKEEQEMVKGLIINKFRGDKDILKPGLTMLEDLSKKKVAGVLPYAYLDVDDEDSLTERFTKRGSVGLIDIAVIKLPRISNFTDFTPLEQIEEVSLRYITKPSECKDADVFIIPGTKSTMADLAWMRQNGLEAALKQKAAEGKIILGICGGYQMLGEELTDPYGVETGEEDTDKENWVMRGMGLLPVKTEFAREKVRTRVTGYVAELKGELALFSKASIEGYEIHMGNTIFSSMNENIQDNSDTMQNNPYNRVQGNLQNNSYNRVQDNLQNNLYNRVQGNLKNSLPDEVYNNRVMPVAAPFTLIGDDNSLKPDGCVKNNVAGSYVHGIFDSSEFLDALLNTAAKKKGLVNLKIKSLDVKKRKEQEYDKLADIIRNNLDMDLIYKILKEGI